MRVGTVRKHVRIVCDGKRSARQQKRKLLSLPLVLRYGVGPSDVIILISNNTIISISMLFLYAIHIVIILIISFSTLCDFVDDTMDIHSLYNYL